MKYDHVDVFSEEAMSGNGLTVVFPREPLPAQTMLEITRELKQFETIFISPPDAGGAYPARIFTMDEELQFAGHPILGAGAVLHKRFFPDVAHVELFLRLGERRISIQSEQGTSYQVAMDQGKADFVKVVEQSHYARIAAALHVSELDIDKAFPIEVVSTGLPYLLVPLQSNLCNSRIVREDFEEYLASFGAKFVYVFDTATLECRSWDNRAGIEDIATGSAAGPLCAYLVKHRTKRQGERINMRQGRFFNRPSVITGWVSQSDQEEHVWITGAVSFFASGEITL
jgi:PhzF family phenazine biosynthesis protein